MATSNCERRTVGPERTPNLALPQVLFQIVRNAAAIMEDASHQNDARKSNV